MEDLITSDFGKRVHPVTGEVSSFHSGIDIGIPEGTPVASSFDGVVKTVSYPTDYDADSTKNAGIYVVVQSSDPEIAMSTRYLHLNQAFVTTGQVVKKEKLSAYRVILDNQPVLTYITNLFRMEKKLLTLSLMSCLFQN